MEITVKDPARYLALAHSGSYNAYLWSIRSLINQIKSDDNTWEHYLLAIYLLLKIQSDRCQFIKIIRNR